MPNKAQCMQNEPGTLWQAQVPNKAQRMQNALSQLSARGRENRFSLFQPFSNALRRGTNQLRPLLCLQRQEPPPVAVIFASFRRR